jgi:hypothetical protein
VVWELEAVDLVLWVWELRTIVKVAAEDFWWFVCVRLDALLVDVAVSFGLRF